jgi:chromate transporter
LLAAKSGYTDDMPDSGKLNEPQENHLAPAWREVFLYFLMLGFINVGGPVAQITMMFNHMVERKHWLSKDRFVKIMAFCHMLPGPEALQLAIYVGYLKRKIIGGILAGLTFIIPGAVVMILLSWSYFKYGNLPQINNVLFILKPAVLGIIVSGIIKLGRAAIKTKTLAAICAGAFLAIQFGKVNFLLVLLVAGLLNLILTEGWPSFRGRSHSLAIFGMPLVAVSVADSRWLQMMWLFLKTGALSFGGAYASLIFLQHGAVDQYHWLTSGQLLDGVALSVVTPGPFMLFATFVGYIAGGVPGAIIATLFVFLPSFIFVLLGARYMEQIRNNPFVRTFLAGVSAAVVGIILVVSLELAPSALVNLPSIAIAVAAFVLTAFLQTDVALVAIGAIVLGVTYAVVRSRLY